MGKLLKSLPKSAIFGLAMGLLGFFLSIHFHSYGSGGCTYIDIGAGGCGVLGVIGGIAAIGNRDFPVGVRTAAGVVAVALGVFHILRGAGLILGPCN